METHGRKKYVAEPALPTLDPRDVEMIERLQQRIQELELQQLQSDSLAEEAKTEPNVWDDEPVDVNPFGGENPRLRYLSLQNITVKEVINKFNKLRMRYDVVEKEEQVVVRFLGVLYPEIADIVSLQPYWTYTNVCRLALKVEKQIKAKNKGSTSLFTSRFTPPTRTASPIAPKTEPKATTPTTSAAGTTRERVNNAPCCYKCGGLRHYACDCPNLKTLAFVPDDAGPIYDTDAEPELDEPGDELVYPNCGKALVIQRDLNVVVSKYVDDNLWFRNNIFRTKCTSKGKICDMIIDGGSCENAVSTYMVEKLGMKTEDYSKPYKDEVWCEVILMDADHILLGLPWQFDRKTKHDEFQNTYSFKKDGCAILNKPAYRMNSKEFAELQRQVTELLKKGLIQESMSSCAVPAFLVPKHGGTFRMCIDSRAVNKITINSLEQHLSHLRQIFFVLRAQKLYANGKKCHFLMTEVTFLGYIIIGSGIKMDPSKVEGGRFTWTSEVAKAFDILKAKVTEAPILALPKFDEVFQLSKLDGYLFKGARLCIPLCSLREAIILKGHASGLAGHFERDKTVALLPEKFYCPKMELDVNRLLERCRTCHIAKTHSSNAECFRKLKPREDGPFCVLKKINDNTYKIELPGHYNISATFNVADLSPYTGDSDDEPDSGSSLFQEGENDADATNERINKFLIKQVPRSENKKADTLSKIVSTRSISGRGGRKKCLDDLIYGYLIEEILPAESKKARAQSVRQEARKKWKHTNSKVRNTSFKAENLVYWSNNASHAEEGGKLGPKWEGPYEVTECHTPKRGLDGIRI
nr:reverse transcriptase domain-containing protein [Tanacetum cinerariifolium]